jgi:hypothetical protein
MTNIKPIPTTNLMFLQYCLRLEYCRFTVESSGYFPHVGVIIITDASEELPAIFLKAKSTEESFKRLMYE